MNYRSSETRLDESFYRSVLSRMAENDSHYMVITDCEGFHVVYEPEYASFEGLKYSESDRTISHYSNAYEAVESLKGHIKEDIEDMGIFQENFNEEPVWSFYLNQEELEAVFDPETVRVWIKEDYEEAKKSLEDKELDI